MISMFSQIKRFGVIGALQATFGHEIDQTGKLRLDARANLARDRINQALEFRAALQPSC